MFLEEWGVTYYDQYVPRLSPPPPPYYRICCSTALCFNITRHIFNESPTGCLCLTKFISTYLLTFISALVMTFMSLLYVLFRNTIDELSTSYNKMQKFSIFFCLLLSLHEINVKTARMYNLHVKKYVRVRA